MIVIILHLIVVAALHTDLLPLLHAKRTATILGQVGMTDLQIRAFHFSLIPIETNLNWDFMSPFLGGTDPAISWSLTNE
jgi:hypothetical protein